MKNSTTPILWISGIVITGGITAFLLFRKSDKKLPLISKPTDEVIKEPKEVTANVVTEPNWEDPFDMRYASRVKKWLAPAAVKEISPIKAAELAGRIHKAKAGFWGNDDEAVIEHIFSSELQDRVGVSNLSAAFWKKYKTDMWQHLRSFLSAREMKKYVSAPVNKLPAYQMS